MVRSSVVSGCALIVAACGRLGFEPVNGANDASDASAAPNDAVGSGARLIFVTSTSHNGAIGGLTAADAICQARAAAALLPGTYKAWLADATQSPVNRMTRHPGAYQLVTGETIAQGWSDLVDGMVASRVNRTENGLLMSGAGCIPTGSICYFICEGGEVWSNVDANGARRNAVDCNRWTTTSATGTAGSTGETDSAWTAGRCSSIDCESELPMFCVQQ